MFLQIVLHLIRPFGAAAGGAAIEWFDRFAIRGFDLGVVDLAIGIFLRKLRGEFAGALTEDDQVGKRIAAEPVRAVQSGGALARGKKPGQVGRLRVAVHADAAHRVMRGRADFHRLLGDVEVRQLHELVIHRGQLLFDVLRRVRDLFLDPRNVEEHAAVRAAATGLHFAVDAAGDVVARQQFRRALGIFVALRVAPAFFRDRSRSAICNCPECRRT